MLKVKGDLLTFKINRYLKILGLCIQIKKVLIYLFGEEKMEISTILDATGQIMV